MFTLFQPQVRIRRMNPFLDISFETREQRDGVRFLYCGQLIHRKGVDLLIDAFCESARVFPRIELTLVGDGPLRADLKQRIPADIRSRVDFAGFHPVAELPRFFAEADVFVLPSRHDGWGVVVNQAVAAGLPVICSDAVGAGADLVGGDENGYLFPAGDVGGLKAAISSFAAEPEKIRLFGQSSREKALDWLPEQIVGRWWELLNVVATAVAGKRPVPPLG
jgi:glycosyltransferase involved in cell wall biosynthesis